MRLARDLLSGFGILIALYLVLVHWGGFSHVIGSLGQAAGSTAKVLQGR